jgi:hypothetical protein
VSNRFKINAVLITGLAVGFYFFFMTSKHHPTLSAALTFGEDPFDAIGSFGVQAALFLGLFSLVRAFRPYRAGAPTVEQKVLLARTEMLGVLAVAVTLAGDAVAMVRYLSQWVGLAAGWTLAALAGGLALVTALVGVLIRRSVRGTALPTIPNAGKRAAVVALASVVILAFYPDSLRVSIPGALFTVVVGAVLLFASMWAFGLWIVPYRVDASWPGAATLPGWLGQVKYQLGLVILLGVLMGLFLVLGESTEGGGRPSLVGMAFVASVYVGLETAGLLIGFNFLRKPLGLFNRRSVRQVSNGS